jgi:hypothetical protein
LEGTGRKEEVRKEKFEEIGRNKYSPAWKENQLGLHIQRI